MKNYNWTAIQYRVIEREAKIKRIKKKTIGKSGDYIYIGPVSLNVHTICYCVSQKLNIWIHKHIARFGIFDMVSIDICWTCIACAEKDCMILFYWYMQWTDKCCILFRLLFFIIVLFLFQRFTKQSGKFSFFDPSSRM